MLLWFDLPSGDQPCLPGHVCRDGKGAMSCAWGERGLRFAGNDRGQGSSYKGSLGVWTGSRPNVLSQMVAAGRGRAKLTDKTDEQVAGSVWLKYDHAASHSHPHCPHWDREPQSWRDARPQRSKVARIRAGWHLGMSLAPTPLLTQ